MGSFAGVNIDAQNLQQAVSLAEQKKLLAEQLREYQLSQSLLDYRNNLPTMVGDVKVAIPQFDLSNNVFIQKKPYLVLQDFTVYVSKKDKKGNPIGQEQHQYPNQKNTVVFLPLGKIGDEFEMQNQYDIALKDGKLKPLDIVTVESLVDKQSGFCGQLTPSQMMQTVARPPCVRVSKGEMLKGYIISGTFTPYDNSGFQSKKPALSFNEFKVFNGNDKSNAIENSIETKKQNENKLTIMIVGAFILGFLLSKD
jgi:hypothetical protein